jgi:hypothetical protein
MPLLGNKDGASDEMEKSKWVKCFLSLGSLLSMLAPLETY